MLHIPDIGMPSPLHLLLCLVDRFAEAVVHLLMNAVFVLIPDKVWDVVNGRFQVVAGLPVILAHLTGLLPSQETESCLLIRHGHRPHIFDMYQIIGQRPDLLPVCKHDELRLPAFTVQQYLQLLLQPLQVHKNHVRLFCQRRFRFRAFQKFMCKLSKRRCLLNHIKCTAMRTCQIKTNMAMIHFSFPPCILQIPAVSPMITF